MQTGDISMQRPALAQASSDSLEHSVDLFVVETPLQLLNAIEARCFFNSSQETPSK